VTGFETNKDIKILKLEIKDPLNLKLSILTAVTVSKKIYIGHRT
jgi:hypothetical protein